MSQALAADPKVNSFVTANAGSGKTKTLIDRVARLLLAGAAPAAILCVTYTKAAAAEMQRRLFQRLGDWSVMDDAALSKELVLLEGAAPHDLGRARALFASALETPGGLKIQTIHAFCERLLKRFPLEAGVSSGFSVMDDAAAALIAREARRAVASRALSVPDGAVGEAYARLSISLDFAAFEAMFAGFEAQREAIGAFLKRDDPAGEIWRACGFSEPISAEAVAQSAAAALDRGLWRRAAEALERGGSTDNKCAASLRVAVLLEAPTIDELSAPFFTKAGTAATWPAKTSALASDPTLRAALLAQQAWLETVREQSRAARVAQDSLHALALAAGYLAAHEKAKALRGVLDFADLIDRTRALVAERPDAAWVLYKLDGGIDHILLDEAQDTAPAQWEIVTALTAEFWAGAGLPGREGRSLFVVGDAKQSIYSFQGAEPARLFAETHAFQARIEGGGAAFAAPALTVSYRSTAAVLSFVDTVLADPSARLGTPPGSEDVVTHGLFREGHPGCVDLWPLDKEAPAAEREAWDAPVDAEAETSANKRLARRIAGEIKGLVERGDAIWTRESGFRPAGFGDVIVLVQRRKALFEHILRELKRRGVPVAGADRLSLSAHIAFDDLMALARFVLFPSDELTLAALLKSPFGGLTDEDLFRLGYGREINLWNALQARAEEAPAWAAALAVLRRAQNLAARHSPFEFYVRVLGLAAPDGRSLRARMLTRLGGEAGDVIEAFLAQTLAAEARGVLDLESLVDAFAGLAITVKREMDAPRGEVRVLTAHGAKGLEAPIVFLPETTVRPGRGSPLLQTAEGVFLWCAAKADDCQASAAARTLRESKATEEAMRVLYVAMTRARERLVLGGRINAQTDPAKVGGWYGLLRDAFDREPVAAGVRRITEGTFSYRRFGPDPQPMGSAAGKAAEPTAPPSWLVAPAPVEAQSLPAAPSRLRRTAPEAVTSPLARTGGLGRYRRGTLIHRLLQILPDLPAEGRTAAAERLMAAERDLTEAQRAEILRAAFGVLDDPRFAPVFGPGSQAEAAIAGAAAGLSLSGRPDRLVVGPDRVLVIDFKTNRPAPARIEDADPAYVLQMALYAAALRAIFPDRAVEAALVWTDGPNLMPVPEKMIAEALAGLAPGG